MPRSISLYSLAIPVAAVLCAQCASAQLNCSSRQNCTDPVPASDISVQGDGIWTDSFGYSWDLTSSNGSVSGSVTAPNPGGAGCPNVTWTVSGSISPSFQTDYVEGSTSFTWDATNPSPSGKCNNYTPGPFTYSGTIQNEGNDYAPNTSWSGAGGQGSTTVMKSPSDIPVSETTMAEGFSSGTYATLGQFRQILNASSGSSDIFQGRQVTEYTGFPTGYDSCWFQTSMVPEFNQVNGSAWNVGYYPISPPYITSLNEWADDYVGYTTDAVNYYQSYYSSSQNSPLCGARVPQAMYILTMGTSGGSQNYTNDTIGEDIYRDHVTAYRAGVGQSTNWPQ